MSVRACGRLAGVCGVLLFGMVLVGGGVMSALSLVMSLMLFGSVVGFAAGVGVLCYRLVLDGQKEVE